MTQLFTPLRLRDLELSNRAWVAPMCMFSAHEGVVGDFHLAHHGSLATGRPGLIMAEATAVVPEGRISPGCAGLWNDAHVEAWSRVVDLVHSLNVPIGIQLSHAGRKGSTAAPWMGGKHVSARDGGWVTTAPSAVPFGDLPAPRALSESEITALISDFAAAARRAQDAGFDAVELHMAHGYLLHQFLSPLSNVREDQYGGSLENRMRVPLAVAKAVRDVWPQHLPVIARISSTDWVEGGWNPTESVELVKRLAEVGVDLVDVSSGGLHADQSIPTETNYQVDIAAYIKKETGALISAVGRITEPNQAEEILALGRADAVRMAKAFLRDPHWPLSASRALGEVSAVSWVPQYERALPWA